LTPKEKQRCVVVEQVLIASSSCPRLGLRRLDWREGEKKISWLLARVSLVASRLAEVGERNEERFVLPLLLEETENIRK